MEENIPSSRIVKYSEEEICPGIQASYALLEGTAHGTVSYSVEVTLISTGETALVKDVTNSKDKACRMFDMICRGGVTPCCIFEVIEDLIESLPEDKLHSSADRFLQTL